ncbi:hypothetical protein SteCoe_30159 [Stentor coeruleus]|uniref:Uncharacterized protein n=1 Tax=Stentor coeruleus TaxID=5963 RepID=A0A1R2B499_9CILI|nr:hypothetical protein SteCoe_30159 [Stentor coeruleus]
MEKDLDFLNRVQGLKLILIDDEERISYYELPQNLESLNKIEDIFLINGKQVTFSYEDLNDDGKIKIINSFLDYKYALKSLTGQGLLVYVDVKASEEDKEVWKCRQCGKSKINPENRNCPDCDTQKQVKKLCRQIGYDRKIVLIGGGKLY